MRFTIGCINEQFSSILVPNINEELWTICDENQKDLKIRIFTKLATLFMLPPVGALVSRTSGYILVTVRQVVFEQVRYNVGDFNS